ncbi:MAG: YfhO family protein [Chloroflexota bacterium]
MARTLPDEVRGTRRWEKKICWLWDRSWPLLALAALVAVFCWRSIFWGEVLVPADLLSQQFPWKVESNDFRAHNLFSSDIIDSQYPARAVARHVIRLGQLPLWDPYTSSGRPLGAMPVYALSFPLNVLLWLLPLDVGFTWLAALRLFISGAAMYAFLRELNLTKPSALLGGIAFAFNGFVIVWLNATAGVTLSLAPLVFWAGERSIKKASAVNLCLLALAAAILVSGGFLAVVLYVLYALSGYLLFRAVSQARQEMQRREALRKLILSALAIALGLALMAPQLWSFWDHLKLTGYDAQRASQQQGLNTEPVHNLIRYLIPDYYGKPAAQDFFDAYPEYTGYVGILPLFLAVLALAGKRRPAVWFFGLLGVLALGMAFGAPFNRWLVRLPGLNMGGGARLKSMVAFSAAVLAAYGLDFLLDGGKSARQIRRVVCAGFLTAAVAGGVVLLTEAYWGPGGAASHVFGRSLKWLWQETRLDNHLFEDLLLLSLWVLGSLALLVAAVKGTISRRGATLGALLLLVFDLVGWGMAYSRPVDRDLVFPETSGIDFLQNDKSLFRVTGLDDVLSPNMPGVYQLQDIAGHDPLAPDRYRLFLQTIDPGTSFGVRGTIMQLSTQTAHLNSPLLDLLNLKYIAVPPVMAGETFLTQDGHFVLVYAGPDMAIFENTHVLPRCYLVSQAEVVTDPEVILSRLANGEIDPRATVLLEESLPQSFLENSAGAAQTVPEIVSYTANRIIVRAQTDAPAWLVLADSYYPGWTTILDGRPAEIYRANYLFRAVFMPPGEHEVAFVFQPLPYYLGSAVRLLALLVMAIALLIGWKRKRSHTDG